MNNDYLLKYKKYKSKYLELKKGDGVMIGGGNFQVNDIVKVIADSPYKLFWDLKNPVGLKGIIRETIITEKNNTNVFFYDINFPGYTVGNTTIRMRRLDTPVNKYVEEEEKKNYPLPGADKLLQKVDSTQTIDQLRSDNLVIIAKERLPYKFINGDIVTTKKHTDQPRFGIVVNKDKSTDKYMIFYPDQDIIVRGGPISKEAELDYANIEDVLRNTNTYKSIARQFRESQKSKWENKLIILNNPDDTKNLNIDIKTLYMFGTDFQQDSCYKITDPINQTEIELLDIHNLDIIPILANGSLNCYKSSELKEWVTTRGTNVSEPITRISFSAQQIEFIKNYKSIITYF